MTQFTPFHSLLGGVLIGLAASVLLLFNGKICGVSGILGGFFVHKSKKEILWRVCFILGLMVGGLIFCRLNLESPCFFSPAPGSWLFVGGLLVGFGTQLGGGCTSGHGVCGLGRMSQRSLVATLTFMATAFLTVTVMRLVGGVS